MTEKPKPGLWVRPPVCQPRKAGKEAGMSIDAAPEAVARAILRPVNVKIIGRQGRSMTGSGLSYMMPDGNGGRSWPNRRSPAFRA